MRNESINVSIPIPAGVACAWRSSIRFVVKHKTRIAFGGLMVFMYGLGQSQLIGMIGDAMAKKLHAEEVKLALPEQGVPEQRNSQNLNSEQPTGKRFALVTEDAWMRVVVDATTNCQYLVTKTTVGLGTPVLLEGTCEPIKRSVRAEVAEKPPTNMSIKGAMALAPSPELPAIAVTPPTKVGTKPVLVTKVVKHAPIKSPLPPASHGGAISKSAPSLPPPPAQPEEERLTRLR